MAAYFARTSAVLPQHILPSGQGPLTQAGPDFAKMWGATGYTSLNISSASWRISHWARLQQRRWKKVLQAAGVHGDHHLGLAGVGQHKAGVLIGLLAGLGAGCLFRHALGHQAGGVALFQLVGKVKVAFGVLVHALKESRLCLRDGFDLRRHHIAEIVQAHIALALHAEGCDAVAGDLGQQGTADPLDAKGEAGVLDGAGVAQVAEHGQELCRLFPRSGRPAGR